MERAFRAVGLEVIHEEGVRERRERWLMVILVLRLLFLPLLLSARSRPDLSNDAMIGVGS